MAETLGKNANLIKFPDRTTKIGQLIDEYLTKKTFNLPPQSIHLLFSANRWELHDSIKSLLLSGQNVILDRYVYSGVAYSAAKSVPGMDLEWCFNPDKGLIKPDLTLFFLNKDSSTLKDRDGFGEERYEQVEFQHKVKEEFSKVFEQISDVNRNVIDVSNKSIEDVFSDVLHYVQEVLKTDSNEFLYF